MNRLEYFVFNTILYLILIYYGVILIKKIYKLIIGGCLWILKKTNK
mgnify:CR=1 FL=1